MKLLKIAILLMPLATPLINEVSAVDCNGSSSLVNQLVELGDIKPKTKDWSQVYVTLNWYRYDFEQKKGVATIIAKCMAPSGAAYFYDVKTGKEVARFTNLGGFKVN